MRPRLQRKFETAGFTLVELLVVIAIIALLLAILMPTLNKVRGQARQVVCASNTKQICVAIQLYAHSYDYMPLASYGNYANDYVSIKCDPATKTPSLLRRPPWACAIFPYINYTYSLTDQYKLFRCPEDKAKRQYFPHRPLSYAFNQETNFYDTTAWPDPSVIPTPSGKKIAQLRGASDLVIAFCINTYDRVLSGNRPWVGDMWGNQGSYWTTHWAPFGDTDGMWTKHNGKPQTNYAMCDGHVETISNNLMKGYWVRPYSDRSSEFRWHIRRK